MKPRPSTRTALRAALCCVVVLVGGAGQAPAVGGLAPVGRPIVPAVAEQRLAQIGGERPATAGRQAEDSRPVEPSGHRPWAVLLAIGAGALSAWALARVGSPGGVRKPHDTSHRDRGDTRRPADR